MGNKVAWIVGILGAVLYVVGSLADGLQAEDVRTFGIVVIFLSALYWLSRKARIDAACELAYKEGWDDRGRHEQERRQRLTLIRSNGVAVGQDRDEDASSPR